MFELDSQQQNIVTSESKHIIVAAGAGSGKTRVLTERIKYLLNKGVEPVSIVAITFTSMAADEMKERLADVDGIQEAFIGTIHSFANKIYKNSGKPYDIASLETEAEMMRSLIRKYAKVCTWEEYLKYRDLVQEATKGKLEMEDIVDYFPNSVYIELKRLINGHPCEEYPETVRTMYKKFNIITFDDLLHYATEYYKSLNSTVEYLFVDELQDIGTEEFEFLNGLKANNCFYIGDDWQAIYGFKGGDVSIFLKFMKDPEWTHYYLENNYRSCKEITDLGRKVIEQVPNIIQKKTNSIRKDTGKVIHGSRFKVEDVLRRIKADGDFKDWFVLARTNKDLYYLQGLMESIRLPYTTFKKSETNLAQMQQDLEEDTVKLLTVHSSKGLESKNVLLYGNFPIICPSYLRNDDERKVMYVGVTRAKDKLVLLN